MAWHTTAGMTASNSDLIRSAQLQCIERESGYDHVQPSNCYPSQMPSRTKPLAACWNSVMCVIDSDPLKQLLIKMPNTGFVRHPEGIKESFQAFSKWGSRTLYGKYLPFSPPNALPISLTHFLPNIILVTLTRNCSYRGELQKVRSLRVEICLILGAKMTRRLMH